VTSIAGTTRDLIEAPITLAGIPLILIDTAGLRAGEDEVETIGIARSRQSLASADLVLWLGDPSDCPEPAKSLFVQSKADLQLQVTTSQERIAVSSVTGEGIQDLTAVMLQRATSLLPGEGESTLNARHRVILGDAVASLREDGHEDPILLAEQLRYARACLDRVTGRAGVEDLLGAIFGRFCLGK